MHCVLGGRNTMFIGTIYGQWINVGLCHLPDHKSSSTAVFVSGIKYTGNVDRVESHKVLFKFLALLYSRK